MMNTNSMQHKKTANPTRGITLLVAVILSSVVLSVALSLLDVAYKQQLLASTAKQSQYAFYAADSAMECALYYDQKQNAFDYTSPSAGNTIRCGNMAILNYASPTIVTGVGGNLKKYTFNISCTGSDVRGSVTVLKSDGSGLCNNTNHTCIYTSGYSTCDTTDPRRIERGLKVLY